MGPEARRIILTIREYENSIRMPEKHRLTYLDENSFVHLKRGDVYAFRYKEYANKCYEYLRFGDDVDLATTGDLGRLERLKVCDTPQIFVHAGFEQKPMLYTQKHLLEAIHKKSSCNPHWHGLPISLMKRLPALLEHPVLLCDSPVRKDTLLAVLCATDKDRLPLILAIQPDGRGVYSGREVETNMILSVYSKHDFARYLTDRIQPEMVVYVDKERSQKLERLARLQLPGYYSNLDFNIILHKPQCLVNSRRSEPERPRSLNDRAADVRAVADIVNKDNPYVDLHKRREHEI